jgi:alpha-L-arabinofuranosidase
VCCQNAGQSGGTGQRGLPLDQMPAYVQEVLDLIEWANGPATSPWGAKRAAAGHPEPFKLQYLGVGNEEHITPLFRERFQMLHAAIKARHPEITVIGTVGPFHSGKDFEEGWKIADELAVAMVDEHYYERPEWFLNNLRRYDNYDRAKSKVYVGEYAAHERDRANTWRSALAEAAYLTSLERNGDVVRLASYAPLLAKQSHTQWRPDMIYFSNTNLLLTANYQVQKLFSQNSGDVTLQVTLGTATNLAVSCVRHTASGDIIVKLVNPGPDATPVQVQFARPPEKGAQIIRTVIAAEPQAVNTLERRAAILPSTTTIPAAEAVPYTPPPYSVTVLRFKSR